MDTQMLKTQIEFFEKFGQMLTSGISVAHSLGVLSGECWNPAFKKELDRMHESVIKGKCFYDICNELQVFSCFTREMLVAGEKNGALDLVCIRIVKGLEKELITQ